MTHFFMNGLAILTGTIAIIVITSRSPIVAVLNLIAVFVFAALYLMVINITYVGLIYFVVYVGAVAVLFLFVIMMLNQERPLMGNTGKEFTASVPLGALLAIVFLLIVGSSLGIEFVNHFDWSSGLMESMVSSNEYSLTTHFDHSQFANLSQAQSLGISLYTNGLLWLILVSFVLLVAMLGPIALCLRTKNTDLNV